MFLEHGLIFNQLTYTDNQDIAFYIQSFAITAGHVLAFSLIPMLMIFIMARFKMFKKLHMLYFAFGVFVMLGQNILRSFAVDAGPLCMQLYMR